MGLLQKQVESVRPGHHHFKLEFIISVHQENSAGRSRHWILPETQRSVSRSFLFFLMFWYEHELNIPQPYIGQAVWGMDGWMGKLNMVKMLFLSFRFPSFHDTAIIDATLGYLMAFLVLLASVKLWHLLRLNPKLHLITSSLQRAWNEMSSFIVVIFIVLVAYSLSVRGNNNLLSITV